MDAAEYKHVVPRPHLPEVHLGRVRGEARRTRCPAGAGADPEDPTNTAPPASSGCRRSALEHLKANAPQPTIGTLVDDAMVRHRARQPHAQGRAAQGLRPRRARQAAPRPDHQSWSATSRSATGRQAKDTLGRVYEYFLPLRQRRGQRAAASSTRRARGARARRDARALAKGRVYDPCCGSGGMFVQQREVHRGPRRQAGRHLIYGQESNYTTWRLAKMNLAIRGIDARSATATPSTTTATRPQGRLRPREPAVQRQRLARPELPGTTSAGPRHSRPGNANFAPCSTSSITSSNQSGEAEIRKAIIEADMVDCVLSRCPASSSTRRRSRCVSGFLARNKKNGRFP